MLTCDRLHEMQNFDNDIHIRQVRTSQQLDELTQSTSQHVSHSLRASVDSPQAETLCGTPSSTAL